jgi:hypothetical protein
MLQEYGLNAATWGEDVLEDDTNRLLLAMLTELRGETLIETAQQAQSNGGSGTPTEDSTTEAGRNERAQLRLGQGTNNVDLGWSVDSSGTIVIEVSFDGSRWFTFEEVPVDAGDGVDQFETTYPYTQVYAKSDLDGDVNRLQIVAGPGN